MNKIRWKTIVVSALFIMLFAVSAAGQSEVGSSQTAGLACTETKEVLLSPGGQLERSDPTVEVEEENPFAFNYVLFGEPYRNEDGKVRYPRSVVVDSCMGNFLWEVSCVDGKLHTQQYLCVGGTEEKEVAFGDILNQKICRCIGTARLFTPLADVYLPENVHLVGGLFGEPIDDKVKIRERHR